MAAEKKPARPATRVTVKAGGTGRPNPVENVDAVVIGGGMAGLVAAWRLKQAGLTVRLLERHARHLGGVIVTSEQEGYRIDHGPNTLRAGNHDVWRLAKDLGLEGAIQTSAATATTRYLLHPKRRTLVSVPNSPKVVLSPQLSIGAKLKVLTERYRGGSRADGGHRAAGAPQTYDESIGSLLTRRFGREVVDNIVAPALSGIFAGDVDKLSSQALLPMLANAEAEYGSLVTALRSRRHGAADANTPEPPIPLAADRVYSFEGGMQRLPNALADQLRGETRFGTKAMTVRRLDRGGFRITTRVITSPEERNVGPVFLARRVVVATPTHHSAAFLTGFDTGLVEDLNQIEYAPMAVVAVAYPRKEIGHALDGFGFLIPRTAKVRSLGAIFVSELFADRAPDGMVLLQAFLGGATDPTVVLEQDDGAIIGWIHEDLRGPLKIRSKKPTFATVRRWGKALPQYNLGHADRVSRLQATATRYPGLAFAGNYLRGVGMNDTVLSGEKAAARVLAL